MEVTIEQLETVDQSSMPWYIRKMLASTKEWVKQNSGCAWVHLDVLRDFQITPKSERVKDV